MNNVVTKQPGTSDQLKIRREKGKIWSHIRKKWLVETPEESVRQEYLCTLVNEYGFSLDQMDEELEVTGRGSGHARADFVIWRTAKDKADSRNPLIIVECKSDNVTIRPQDYGQGDNYSRLTGAKRYETDYGNLYSDAIARVRAAVNKPIASLFELPKGEKSKVKTEILFIERCLALLKPGGRLGIVLPEGIFNNPSLAYVREFCENRAFIRAVVSLPQETFVSSGASVKASLLFVQKFTAKEQADFDAKQAKARGEVEENHADAIAKETKRLKAAVELAKEAGDADKRKTMQRELADYQKRMSEIIATETRALLKEKFPYPIFLYEAEKVGITATGDSEQNELFPNDNQPRSLSQTCIELYRGFRRNPKTFFLAEAAR